MTWEASGLPMSGLPKRLIKRNPELRISFKGGTAALFAVGILAEFDDLVERIECREDCDGDPTTWDSGGAAR